MHNSQPVIFRPSPIIHGHYAATMARPSFRQRIVAWWHDSRQAIVRDIALTLAFLAAFALLNWVIDLLLWAVDRIGS